MSLLLVHPPAIKAGEPPLGVAILAGHLRRQGVSVRVLDANLGAYLHLLQPQQAVRAAGPRPSTTVRRALAQAERSLALLRSPTATESFPRYATAVRHLQTLLGLQGRAGERLTLGDYSHPHLSPFAPEDLRRLAAGAEQTLFAGYFREVLLPPLLAAPPPTLIAFSINYRHQLLPAFEFAGMLRRAFPNVGLVAGGGMITSWRAALLARGATLWPFDHLIFGPGEGALDALARGAKLPELQDGGATLAFAPDFDGLDLAGYLSPQPVLPLAASRGCYWGRCRFCPEAVAPTHPYAPHAASALAAELKHLAGRYQVRHFHLTDNAVPPAALHALAQPGILPAAARWHGFVRFEKALLTDGLLPALAKNGCALLQLGLESGAQHVLDAMCKGTNLAVASAVLKALHRAGIASYVYVMFGIPGETAADAAATLAFLEEHAEFIGYLNLALMNLPRDADLATAADPLLAGGELALYRSFTPTPDWGRAEARRFLAVVAAAPRLRPILARTPPFFTSNHAFFFGT